MFRLTRHGLREMLIGTAALAVIAVGLGWVWWPLALATILPLVWLFAFFRDPERAIPTDPRAMVSPADGTVSDIVQLPHHELLGEPCVRVGIFLSIFNVHINRSPCDGRVKKIIYKQGEFHNALRGDVASEHNESNTVVLDDPETGRPLAVVKQIAGLIARRIVFTPQVGDLLRRGQRIGMIKFGSRTELFIPARLQPQIQVQVGQKVRGASDVIAVLASPLEGQAHKADGEAVELEPAIGREKPT